MAVGSKDLVSENLRGLDDDGLLHLVADHEALTDLAVATSGQAGPGRTRLGLAHATPSFGATERPSSRSRMIV